jgi:hypothetical protein
MLFAYCFQIDGGLPRRGEIEASSRPEAVKLATLRHATDGGTITISRIFEPPLRHGHRPPTAPELPRINFRHSLYERPLRRQARRETAG